MLYFAATRVAYLRFLAEELVPMVEARYGTSRDRDRARPRVHAV